MNRYSTESFTQVPELGWGAVGPCLQSGAHFSFLIRSDLASVSIGFNSACQTGALRPLLGLSYHMAWLELGRYHQRYGSIVGSTTYASLSSSHFSLLQVLGVVVGTLALRCQDHGDIQ